MSQPAIVIEQDQLATVAVDLMLEKNVKRLPVVDATGKLVGILSRLDVFQTIIRECPDWRAFQNKNIHVENLKLVSDIVRNDACTVLSDTPVDEVIQIIDCNDIERVCVVDKDGFFLGMISDQNLLIAFVDRHPEIWDYLMSKIPFTEKGLRYRELKEHLQAKTAAEVMKKEVLTIREDAPLEEAIRLMLERVIKRLPVVDGDGRLLPMIGDRLNAIAGFLKIHILTADTFGMAKAELADISCDIFILTGDNHDVQKEEYVWKLSVEKVIALGNGNNDRRMLRAARVGMAVLQGEGCSVEALLAANVHVTGADIGLDLLLHPKRLKATLRF